MKKCLLIALLLCTSISITIAQNWYVGVDAGVSFGSSTFKSFGMDKTRVGIGGGILGGYHINSFLSAEAEFSYHHLGLGVYNCCKNSWLGSDGNRYLAPVAGMDGWQYSNLHSAVSMYGLGAKLNVDLVRFFKPKSKWSFLTNWNYY